jgi:hypothetical protein
MMLLRDRPLVLLIVAAIVLRLVVELGYRVERRRGARDEKRHEQNVATRDQLGLLLSLLLGFTLAMSLSRYDLRKQLVVNEANAIGTAMLRVELLPDQVRPRLRELFREYVKMRISFAQAGLDEREIGRVRAQSKPMQEEIWRLTVTASEASPTPITGTFVQSVNETFDLEAARLAALENRIPLELWAMLTLLSVFAAYMLGTTIFERSRWPMLVVPLMIAVVTALIADLDTPRAGFIHDDQRAMERLLDQNSPNAPSPAP